MNRSDLIDPVQGSSRYLDQLRSVADGILETETSADDDRDEHSEVTLEVGPHPELSEMRAKVVALDYGMRSGPADRRPQDQQIVPLNRDVVHLQDRSQTQ